MTNSTIENNIVEIEISLLDNKPLKIKCLKSEAISLQESAALVRSKISEVKKTIKFAGSDKLSQITALNMAYDLLQMKKKQTKMRQDLDRFIKRIETKTSIQETT